MQNLKYGFLALVVVILTACGGGGGGGGGSGGVYNSPNPYLRPNVPYGEPKLVGIHHAQVGPTANQEVGTIQEPYSVDLNGTGSESVIFAGRSTGDATTINQYKLSLYTWENNTLVDKTAQWFAGTDNVIVGTEPSVKFSSFNNNGRKDMFIAPSTDGTNQTGKPLVFMNNGSSFTRQEITINVHPDELARPGSKTTIWSHDSAVADINNDGFTDIIMSDYGWNTTIAMNNRNGTFSTYTQQFRNLTGNSSLAVADFLNNGTKTILTVDGGSTDGVKKDNPMRLYSWNIDAGNNLNFNLLGIGPEGRFSLPKWSSYGFGTVNGVTSNPNHNVRVVPFDFDNSGVMSAFVLTRPARTDAGWAHYSEIQFLKNNGSGVFTDVTDTTVFGYNTNTMVSYNPKLLDFNNDGLIDILLSSQDFSGNNNSHQILLHKPDHTYISAYQNIITDFATQANTLVKARTATNYQFNGGNSVDIIKSPDGKLYFVTAVQYWDGTAKRNAVYLSYIGDPASPTYTASQAFAQIKALWPYLNDNQINEALAKTSANYFNIGQILNPDTILNPVGPLGIPTMGRIVPITGYISGVRLDSGNVVAMDTLNRSYTVNLMSMNAMGPNRFGINTEHIDQYNLTSHAEYLINGTPVTAGPFRLGAENRIGFDGRPGSDGANPAGGFQNSNYTFGMPSIYRKGNWNFGSQYTSLNSNPWLAFGGAWGSVNSSITMDHVVTYYKSGFSSQTGLMHTSTNINPGLVTKVHDIFGVWHESGYRYKDLGMYLGVKPVVISGSIETRMPTGIDMNGNFLYTTKKLPIQSATIPYARALWTANLNKNTMYRLSAMSTFVGNQYRIMNEVRFYLD